MKPIDTIYGTWVQSHPLNQLQAQLQDGVHQLPFFHPTLKENKNLKNGSILMIRPWPYFYMYLDGMEYVEWIQQ